MIYIINNVIYIILYSNAIYIYIYIIIIINQKNIKNNNYMEC